MILSFAFTLKSLLIFTKPDGSTYSLYPIFTNFITNCLLCLRDDAVVFITKYDFDVLI